MANQGNPRASMHSFTAQKTDDIQERLLHEIQMLKGNPDMLARPGTGNSAEIDKMRRERD